MIPVSVMISGFGHQPDGSVEVNPVVGLQLGNVRVYMSPEQTDHMIESLRKAKADALTCVANAEASGTLLAASTPAGRA